jgi:hypothetical protein
MFKLNICWLILIISATSAVGSDDLCVDLPNGSFLNNPRSCAAFFQCWEGVAIDNDCADGFFFNPIAVLCDWPENVDCVDEPSTPPQTPPTLPTPSPTTAPTTPAPPPPIQCPPTGAQLMPHPESCSFFIFCWGGVPQILECPADKHFSEELQTCIDQELADCDIDDTICQGVIDFTLIPSTVDCNEYFICFNSTSVHRNCAPELHFNPIELRCESKHTAGCLVYPDPEPDCPADEFFAILPHPTSCSLFFYCIDGIAKLQECAPGLLFDADRLHCDHASNVICVL